MDTIEMRKLLGSMLDNARQKNSDGLESLNEEYRSKMPYIAETGLERECDKCRQSCYLSMRFPELYDKFISDAEERLDRIDVMISDID